MICDAPSNGLPFGEDRAGRLIHVSEVPSGLACGMICPGCRTRLIAKKGEIMRHHFAHEADSECVGALETMIHKLAKQIIADAGGVTLPALWAHWGAEAKRVSRERWFPFDRVDLEVWKDGIRPDVIGFRGARELAVEVRVTHACGPEKIAFIEARQLATVEIDLSDTSYVYNDDEFKTWVLSMAPREWLFNARLAPVVEDMRKEAAANLVAEIERRAVAEAAKLKAEQDRIAALSAEARAWEERRAVEHERMRVLNAEWAAQQAAKEAADERERAEKAKVTLAAFKSDIERHAKTMLGDAAGTAWCKRIRDDRALGNPQSYWDALRNECDRVDSVDAAAKKSREILERAATMHFRSPDRATLWMRSKHPRLAMTAPADACLSATGLTNCLGLLR